MVLSFLGVLAEVQILLQQQHPTSRPSCHRDCFALQCLTHLMLGSGYQNLFVLHSIVCNCSSVTNPIAVCLFIQKKPMLVLIIDTSLFYWYCLTLCSVFRLSAAICSLYLWVGRLLQSITRSSQLEL